MFPQLGLELPKGDEPYSETFKSTQELPQISPGAGNSGSMAPKSRPRSARVRARRQQLRPIIAGEEPKGVQEPFPGPFVKDGFEPGGAPTALIILECTMERVLAVIVLHLECFD